jgi:hypothetical protein
MNKPSLSVLLGHNFYRSSSPSGEDAVFENEKRLLSERGTTIIPFTRHNNDTDDTTFGSRFNLALDSAWSKST